MEKEGRVEGEIPSFSYVEDLLERRLLHIMDVTEADEYRLFLSEGKSFRDDIAKSKPYKGTRKSNRPWHYNNLTAYMKDVLNAEVCTGIEADDALAINQSDNTVICTRDKDLRQVPGWTFSWELGRQPSFGPHLVTPEEGFRFFCTQMLTGDVVDNIPGLPGIGPVKARKILEGMEAPEDMLYVVHGAYTDFYKEEAFDRLTEQGQLLWIVRRYNEDGTPAIWKPGMYE